jgi:hypothetical protein
VKGDIDVLPFSKPEYVKAPKETILNACTIEAVGLASDSVLGVVIDDKVALEQIHPTYSLALLPLTEDVSISYRDVLFYADCFSYEHEIPVLAYPRKSQIEVDFLLDKRGKRITRDIYLQELMAAMESINLLRFGPVGYVEFRYDTSGYLPSLQKPIVRLDYTRKYKLAAKQIHLYSFALRQLDPMSEYLCYYRALESASGSNGLKWLEENLGRLESVQFGVLPASGDPHVTHRRRRKNLFALLSRRAVTRLKDLSNEMSHAQIAERLYRTNRCGIAHGRSIRRADFSTDFNEVYLDGFVIKLSARLAIEDRVSVRKNRPFDSTTTPPTPSP